MVVRLPGCKRHARAHPRSLTQGIPVVTCNDGKETEGVAAACDGNILLADDPASFAQAVIRLVQNPELRCRLAENGRRLAEQKHDWRESLFTSAGRSISFNRRPNQ